MSTHFLATPLGKIVKTIPQPTKISAENIIKPSFDELSEDQRQHYETWRKQRQDQMREEYEAKVKKQEEEDMEAYLENYSKDRQGKTTPLGKIKLPLLGKRAEPSVSESLFSSEQIAVIQSYVSDGNDKIYR